MKQSLIKKVVTILISLTFLFLINTIISGITSSQVALSAELMSKVFIPFKQEQKNISKSIDKIYYMTHGDIVYENLGLKLDKEKNDVENSLQVMLELSILSSEKIMTTTIEDAYINYQSTVDQYLDVLEKTIRVTEDSDIVGTEAINASEKIYKQVMDESLVFEQVLAQSLEHEDSLINSRVTRASLIVWVMGFIYLLAAIISALVLRDSVKRPLKNALNQIQALTRGILEGSGDLTIRFQIQNDDEIGAILKSMNKFMDILQHAMISIKTSSEALNITADTIESHVIESGKGTESISSTMTELSASMEEISASIQTIDSSAKNIYVSAEKMSGNAVENGGFVNKLNQRADEIHKDALNNSKQVLEVVNQIKVDIKSAMDNSMSVHNISDLTTEILDIASRTNLLALNASIEAARAGEAGKGFAVVADEIRKLSESTQHTANSIQEISHIVIGAVQHLADNSDYMVEYINKNIMNDYDDFVAVSGEYAQKLSDVNRLLEEFVDESSVMKNTSGIMATGIEEISYAIEDSVKGVINTTDEVYKLVDNIEEISKHSDLNKNLSDTLKKEIDIFKNIE